MRNLMLPLRLCFVRQHSSPGVFYDVFVILQSQRRRRASSSALNNLS